MTAPKDGHTLTENLGTQPLARHRAFNNHEVLTEGWYPALPSKSLPPRQARSVRIGYQRLVVFRGEDGRARALDAFCPHMGADLSNGKVVGDQIECYFHQWRFNAEGACTGTRCGATPPKGAQLAAWPVEERYGFVWIYSAAVAAHPLPVCPGLEGDDVAAIHLGRVTLYAHHHAMMAGGIDLQHFGAVHDLDIDFELAVDERDPGVADWSLAGDLPAGGSWRQRLGRWLLGARVGYTLRVAGGSIAAISYGREQRFRGRGFALPSLHILWGCVPTAEGPSQVDIFVLARRRDGWRGRLTTTALMGLTMALLALLKDDDVKAFPNMRFNPRNLVAADRSVARFIQYANQLPLSPWSRASPALVELKRVQRP
jgi:phenylpropionate dioxygenase-like ring-hydroxylating dioxygenase large terminal subunit